MSIILRVDGLLGKMNGTVYGEQVKAANEHMTMLEKNPQRFMSYFQDCRVRYAA
jgi:hypothetical protein